MCVNVINLRAPTHLSLCHTNTEIRSALTQLENMDPKELQEFHRKYNLQFKGAVNNNALPTTPIVSSDSCNPTTTPEITSQRVCLQQVENITRSTLTNKRITSRDGRDELTSIYNKMRAGKKDPLPRKGRKLRPCDVDGKGDERFEAACKLMFTDGFTAVLIQNDRKTSDPAHREDFRPHCIIL